MKALLIFLFTILSTATQGNVLCHTPRSNKVFEIKNSKVTFFNEFDTGAKRELASVSSRTNLLEKGLTKIVNFENKKHTIHIENIEHFSDTEDYIIIKAKSGHEVIYPLSCQNN
jgi:hypothetical protein